MTKQLYIFVVIGAIVIAGGAFLFSQKTETPIVENQRTQQKQSPKPELKMTSVVSYTDSGFVPQTFIVKQGDTVIFVNQSSAPTWPASAMHPTHTVYPGSGIQKCGTSEKAGIFDACKGISQGQEWPFQFNEKGSWQYHDHLNASHYGTIVVK